jgi:hypothetical protein
MERANLVKHTATGKRQFGQAMTEYIIIASLVAIAALGVYNLLFPLQ